MEQQALNCYGLVISFDPADKTKASIDSDMKDVGQEDNAPFNVAVKSIEMMVLAHFITGVDVAHPGYLEGIKTSYGAINLHYDDTQDAAVADEDDAPQIVTIEMNRRVQAIANEVIQYDIARADWESANEEWGDPETALSQLQAESKTKRIYCESEIEDLIATSDTKVFEV